MTRSPRDRAISRCASCTSASPAAATKTARRGASKSPKPPATTPSAISWRKQRSSTGAPATPTPPGRVAQAAVRLGAGELLKVLADESVDQHAGRRTCLSKHLLAEARTTEDSAALCELYERLSKLNRARGDASSALLWHSRHFGARPGSILPALRQSGAPLHRRQSPRGAGARGGAAGGAHRTGRRGRRARALGGSIRIRMGAWEQRERARVLAALTHERPKACGRCACCKRKRPRRGRARRRFYAVTQKLQRRTDRPADKATLLLRGAEAAARSGQLDQAQLLLELRASSWCRTIRWCWQPWPKCWKRAPTSRASAR